METFIGIMIPFLGTTLGSACVFFMKKSLGDLVQRSLAGFAAGVMVAASIWSLLTSSSACVRAKSTRPSGSGRRFRTFSRDRIWRRCAKLPLSLIHI